MSERLARELAELAELGRASAAAPYDVEAAACAVLARLGDEPVPVAGRRLRLRRWVRARRRVLAALLAGALVGLALTAPVRAEVAGWFDLGGVRARVEPRVAVPDGAAPPGCGALPVAEAGRRAGLVPLLPAGVRAGEVTAGVAGRVLSLCWRDAAGARVRVDQFPATLDPGFYKTAAQPWEGVEVGAGSGAWFARAHRLELPFADGSAGVVRPAGPTLVWSAGGVTLRLEGVADPGAAVRIAGSLKSAGTGGS
ncbi:hypothetical protein ACFQLX_04255 [Streptomyces polyrhachis]|uniref:DUF4367 domain-containing protein n=1 Tax=Streptomyces polyrhachis TaxID=1282885 RepID=A0ABW2GDB3_9ACTN